ncbi:MAG: hypothetical protein ACC660_01750 [Acidimicrobiales bacterium]
MGTGPVEAGGDGAVRADRDQVQAWLAALPDTEAVAGFVPGPGIARLQLRFDMDELCSSLAEVVAGETYASDYADKGFGAIGLTRRPGMDTQTEHDLSGRYWLRADDRYVEEPYEDPVDEAAYSELTPACRGTYFEHVHHELAARFPIGRMRLLSKDLYNCNSWHRDPEPRVHVPIISNPGSLFIVNNHCTHLPADGSVYFTDTRGYHTALNGGLTERVHLVAAIPVVG